MGQFTFVGEREVTNIFLSNRLVNQKYEKWEN